MGVPVNYTNQTLNKTAYTNQTVNKTSWTPDSGQVSLGSLLQEDGSYTLLTEDGNSTLAQE